VAPRKPHKAKPISGPMVVEKEMGLRIAGIRIHSAAKIIGDVLPDDRLDELAADIKQHGLKQPLLFLRERDGYSLLDGRNRLRALELLGDVKLTSDGLPKIAHDVVQTEDPIALTPRLPAQDRHRAPRRAIGPYRGNVPEKLCQAR
jgi:ParB/Sulfiredoxin domain